MNARFYVPYLNRFISADTIVPDPTNPQSLNRYSYVLNNPLKFIDPSGHRTCDLDGNCQESRIYQNHFVTKLWIDPENVEEIQLYGNTNFAFDLDGTGPSYAYSQGFHGGLDLLANAGTEVVAGVYGTVKWVSDWTAYKPRYVVIEIAPGSYIVIGHLSADDSSALKAGQDVTPNTVIGTVAEIGDGDHIHVEFWTGTGNRIGNRVIQPPYRYMSPEVKKQFLGLAANMDDTDSRITFHNRSDGMWSSYDDQPALIYNGDNLNEEEPGYENPWD